MCDPMTSTSSLPTVNYVGAAESFDAITRSF